MSAIRRIGSFASLALTGIAGATSLACGGGGGGGGGGPADPPYAQEAYVKASNTDAGDSFGFSVALSGDTMVVGAPREDSFAHGVGGDQADDSLPEAGAAYVFVRVGDTWTQQA